MSDGFQLAYQFGGEEVIRNFDQGPVVIGHSDRCTLKIDSPHIAPKHAEVVRESDGWTIRARAPSYKVAVNGQVVSSQRLSPGDRITLATGPVGSVVLEFRLPEAARSYAPRVALGDQTGSTSVVASIDLRELADSLSKEGRVERGESRAKSAHVGLSTLDSPLSTSHQPQLPALGLFKSAGEILLANEGLDEMLQQMADLIGRHLPGRRVAVCMNDLASGELLPRCFSRETPPGTERSLVAWPRPFPISRSILQEAVRVRRALLVASAPDDPRFRAAASIRQMDIRSAACVPLYHEGRIEGAVYVDSQHESGPLSDRDLEVLTVLGLMVAAGIAQMALRSDVARERTIRDRLARYNSPQVVEQIMRRTPRLEDEMAADEYEVSVLFADLGGFTALAECWPAAEVVRVLNLVFERWAADVFALDGTLDKYIGDAVMAVFGAPLRQADHARRAVATALAMRQSLDGFNRLRPQEPELRVRIGINSGRVIAGDIGSPLHRAYTVIGDAVNIASRLETAVAQPGQIVIGQATCLLLQDHYLCESLGQVQLRGKRQMIEAYRVVGERDSAVLLHD